MANTDISTTLYNGQHKVTFKNASHRYRVDEKAVTGVTTIMGKVLAKPGLMLWPLNMALKHLDNKIGDGDLVLISRADLEDARNAHVTKRDAGADTGTIVHGLVEQYLAGNEVNVLESDALPSEAISAYSAFRAWDSRVQPKTVAVEQVVYSHALNYAGTFDSILEIDGKTYLCDLKTTNASRDAPKGVYAENFIQLGAYYYAYEEQRQYELANGGTNLVEIDDLLVISCRKDGRLNTVAASELGLTLQACMDMWVNTFSLYHSLEDVKNRLYMG